MVLADGVTPPTPSSLRAVTPPPSSGTVQPVTPEENLQPVSLIPLAGGVATNWNDFYAKVGMPALFWLRRGFGHMGVFV